MKKFLVIFLSIALILVFASCGKKNAGVQTVPSSGSTSSASVSEPEPVPESIPEPEKEPEAEPVTETVQAPAEDITEETAIAAGDEDTWTFTAMDVIKYAMTVVNVRDLPSLEGKKLGVLRRNTPVHIIGRCNETGWFKFEYKDGIAYGHDDYFADEKVNVQVSIENKTGARTEDTRVNDSETEDTQSDNTANGNNQSTVVRNTYPYPDPLSVSLSVTPITKDNYATYIGGAPSGTYKDDTVLGFVVSTNGISSYMDLFDRIEFYVYDAQYYATTMKPISNALKSSNPGAGTALTAVSNEGQPDVQGQTYFYPATDNHYAAKVSIDLKRASDNVRLTDPRVIFLFSEFTGNKAACESALSARTSGLAGSGYNVSATVNNSFAGGVFSRGRDYEFTFRLHVDETEVPAANDRMYPEVLGEDIACIIKAPASAPAPFESPDYYFYPADSGDSYLTYGYYVKVTDPDIAASDITSSNMVFSTMQKTAGTDIKTREVTSGTGNGTDWGSIGTCPVHMNHDAQVRVDGLTKNTKVSVGFVEYGYIAGYTPGYIAANNRGKAVTAFTRSFTGTNSVPSATFGITADDGNQRTGFAIHFATAAQAKSIAAIVGRFTTSAGDLDAKLSISSVSGTEITAYVPHSKLVAFKDGNGNWPQESIAVTLKIYYDSGHEGFQQQFLPYSTERFVCIREAGVNGEGQYIIPADETNGSDFVNKNQSPQSINAAGSIFKMTLNSGVGAQHADINGTLSNTPGKVGVELKGFVINTPTSFGGGSSTGTTPTEFQYDSENNAVARLGGMFDANITDNQLGFTVSVVKEYDGAKGVISNSMTENFTLP